MALAWARGSWKTFMDSRYILKVKPADELDGGLRVREI